MGLDGVELVMECEDEFGIKIPDADASLVFTPRQLTDMVIRLMRQQGELPPAHGCQSSRMFYRFRKCLTETCVGRDEVKPSTTLGKLLDTPDAVRAASEGLNLIGAKTSVMQLDQLLRVRKSVVGGLIAAGVVVALIAFNGDVGIVSGIVLISGALLFISYMIYEVIGETRSELMEPEQTVSGQIKHTIESGELYSDNADERAVWIKIRTIIAEQLGLSMDRVTPDADFVKDLGLI